MHPNHHYLLDLGIESIENRPDATALDYGCGNGEIVEEGLRRGLSIYGVDVFHEPTPETRDILRQKGLFRTSIREIHDGKIPFEDGFFDVVTTNMVFEHVRDLEAVLREINRVLKTRWSARCAVSHERGLARRTHWHPVFASVAERLQGPLVVRLAVESAGIRDVQVETLGEMGHRHAPLPG